jgi:hypothetical protein
MLHKFFEEGDWFRPKSYGYGAGLPIAWQGWVVLAAYVLLVVGLAIWASASTGFGVVAVTVTGIALATAGLVSIVHKRTRGGWRWRWGAED